MFKIQKKFLFAGGFLCCICFLLLFLFFHGRGAEGTMAPKETLTYLVNIDDELSNVCGGDLNQTYFFQELEKRTNIHITFSTSPKNLQSIYQFQQNDRSHPDLIDYVQLHNIYGKSLEQCLSDGVILDLTDLAEKYAPNYYRLIQQPEYRDFAYTSSGRIAAVYSLKQERQNSYAGLQIRKDWLDELNLDIPVTYDDWETVLSAFKEEKGASAPLYLPAPGYMANETFHAGFGVGSGFFHIDDTVFFGPAEEGWKAYLKMLHRWYKKELIDPNFMSGEYTYASADAIRVGACGAWYGLYTMPSTISFDEQNQNAKIAAVPCPKQNSEDELHLQNLESYTDNFIAITSECKNPQLALQWIDYLFSEEGSLFASYGTEGETYTLNEAHEPEFTDLILDNPEGLSFTQALKFYTFTPGFASAYIDWKREQQSIPAEDAAMCDIWSEGNDAAYILPSNLSFEPEEQERLTEISETLYPLVSEYTISFISGITPLSEFHLYLDKLESCGLSEALQIYQTAWNRYRNQE